MEIRNISVSFLTRVKEFTHCVDKAVTPMSLLDTSLPFEECYVHSCRYRKRGPDGSGCPEPAMLDRSLGLTLHRNPCAVPLTSLLIKGNSDTACSVACWPMSTSARSFTVMSLSTLAVLSPTDSKLRKNPEMRFVTESV